MKNWIILLLPLALMASACANKSSDSAPAPTGHVYSYVNGSCFDSTANMPVANTFCTTTPGYVVSNGYCYSSSTGQPVNPAYCTASASGVGQCNGTYIFYSAGYMQQVPCSAANNYCSGYTLIEASSGRQVTCP